MSRQPNPDHSADAFLAHAQAGGLRSITHLRALLLFSDGEEWTTGDLAQLLEEGAPNTNYIVGALIQHGLLTKGDGPKSLISATEKGLQLAERILYGHNATSPET